MELYVPSLSPMRNAIQLACGSGGRHKYYFKLSISLVLFSLPTATLALTPRYSPATQCGRFSVSWTWGESSRTTKPPFYLLILPFDAQATILELPRYSYDVNTYAGNFTTPDGLRLKSGTQYIVCMGDGDGVLFSRPRHFRGLTRPFWPLSVNRQSRRRDIFGPDSGRLVQFKLHYSRCFADELVLHARPNQPTTMLAPDSIMEFYTIHKTTQYSSICPVWPSPKFRSSEQYIVPDLGGEYSRRDADSSSRPVSTPGPGF